MRAQENWLLLGSFLCVLGVFMPWHSFQYTYPVAGVIAAERVATLGRLGVPGYLTVTGLACLASAVVAVTVILSGGHRGGSRRRAGIVFFACLTVALFILGGVIPLFSFPGVGPRVGLVVMAAGAGIVGVGLGRRDGTGGPD